MREREGEEEEHERERGEEEGEEEGYKREGGKRKDVKERGGEEEGCEREKGGGVEDGWRAHYWPSLSNVCLERGPVPELGGRHTPHVKLQLLGREGGGREKVNRGEKHLKGNTE